MTAREIVKRIEDLELLVDHILLNGYAKWDDELGCVVGININNKAGLLNELREKKNAE